MHVLYKTFYEVVKVYTIYYMYIYNLKRFKDNKNVNNSG